MFKRSALSLNSWSPLPSILRGLWNLPGVMPRTTSAITLAVAFLWMLAIYTNPEYMLLKRSLSIAKFRIKNQNTYCCTSLIHQQQERKKLWVLIPPNVYFYINMALITVSTSKSKGLYLLRILWNQTHSIRKPKAIRHHSHLWVAFV